MVKTKEIMVLRNTNTHPNIIADMWDRHLREVVAVLSWCCSGVVVLVVLLLRCCCGVVVVAVVLLLWCCCCGGVVVVLLLQWCCCGVFVVLLL